MVVAGAGSQWNNAQALSIGEAGAGELTITDGASVKSSTYTNLGTQAGATGKATVSGRASSWTVDGNLQIGFGGSGVLIIKDGGQVSNTKAGFLSYGTGTTSSLLIQGGGSTLAIQNEFYIGDRGATTVRIADGGRLSNAYAYVGNGVDGAGEVTVTGQGSTWNTTALVVGREGIGKVTIANGAKVTSTWGATGANAGSYGEVLVTGQGSVWDMYSTTSWSEIGDYGDGKLTVADGGTVYLNFGSIASRGVDSKGELIVTGAGSSLNSRYGVSVGATGAGRLAILDGGVVNSDSGYIGAEQYTGSGVVDISGPGSQWNFSTTGLNHGMLAIGAWAPDSNGAYSTGTVNLSNQGTIKGTQVHVGFGTLNIGAPADQTAVAPGIVDSETVLFYRDTTGILNFNHTAGNYVFSSIITSEYQAAPLGPGSGTINQLSGVTRLTGDSSHYDGLVNIKGGVLLVDNKLGNAQSIVNISGSGALGGVGIVGGSVNNDGTLWVGDQTDSTLARDTSVPATLTINGDLHNTGAIFVGRDDTATVGNQLIVNGNYSSNNGLLHLNGILGSDNSVVDKLLVQGATSGTTRVAVKNIGGGAQTLNGIEVVRVEGNSDGEFVQEGRIVAGAYDYILGRGKNGDAAHWYLTSNMAAVPPLLTRH